ncbi:MAG TPA: Atu2307/SP_0267 family LLM class monooxygenase [Trueperaceae bacterium]|nr:Atu2307/SP_0267 family LLM class monooxygenase [Trueperaceae bacterium]
MSTSDDSTAAAAAQAAEPTVAPADPATARPFELGLTTFVELTPDPASGVAISPEQRFKNLLEEVELADQVGLDVFGVGEHHRDDFLVSAPAVVLAAAAGRTSRIRLSSAVTVLSSDDPVRVMEQFATLDLLSSGRAEIMAGRGSFIESFPLFGHDVKDYDSLFAEKLELLIALAKGGPVSWAGRHRTPLRKQQVYPEPLQRPLPIWIAVGGTPESAARAGHLGLPMVLAIIGGMPERFAPFADIHVRAAQAADHAAPALAINSHGFIAADSRVAADTFFGPYAMAMTRIGRERGWSGITREQFEAGRQPRGHLVVGEPDEVIEKILFQHELFGNQRYLLQFSVGTAPHAKMLESIELFGTTVAPVVRREVAARTTSR